MECCRSWIRPERDFGRRWICADASRLELDGGMIWIATGYGLMTGGGGQVKDLGR